MADEFGIVWKGVREFDRALAEIPKREAAATKVATLEAAAELVFFAKRDAPHGATGRLASSIVPEIRMVGGDPVGKVGPTTDYGRRVELGFKGRKSARGVKKRRAAGIDTGRRGLQPTRANPFLARALDESRLHLADVYKKAWAKAL